MKLFPNFYPLLCVAAICLIGTKAAGADTTFTYQGILQSGGLPEDGEFDFKFRLLDAPVDGNAAAMTLTNFAVAVTSGVFTADVDFGSESLNGANRWLEIGVRPAGSGQPFTTLSPRQMLTSAPYAIKAESAENLQSGNIENPVFVGTLNADPFDLSVNGIRALRLIDNGDGSDDDDTPDGAPNVIGGSSANFVSVNTVGSTIGGGGATDFGGFVFSNSIKSDYSVISGGLGNLIETNAMNSLVAGGVNNWILGGSRESIIGGGSANLISEDCIGTSIAGGAHNRLESLSPHSTIGGGIYNTIDTGNTASTVSGGIMIRISPGNRASAVGGGESNAIGEDADWSTISGGTGNYIGDNSTSSLIGGGTGNQIGTNSYFATISGGLSNRVGDNSERATIGGGAANTVGTNSPFAIIPGGLWNTATNFALAAGLQAKAVHTGAFVWGDSTFQDISSQSSNSVTFRASGGYRLFSNAAATAGVSLAPNATAWSVISDRAMKKDFATVDSQDVLEKLTNVPIMTWHYHWESSGAAPHIGPAAQDFKATFFPDRDNTKITTLEFDGVALAAIQGLNAKLEEKSAELEKLKRENDELNKRLSAIEAKLK